MSETNGLKPLSFQEEKMKLLEKKRSYYHENKDWCYLTCKIVWRGKQWLVGEDLH